MKQSRKIRGLIILLVAAVSIGLSLLYLVRRKQAPLPPLSALNTLAGADALRFKDPFGLAVAPDRTVYVTDGGSGIIWRITPDGSVKKVAENLDVPSAIAVAPDGTLVVAETGSHTIMRVDPVSGQSQIIAGVRGRSGFNDGVRATALFNAPVGIAVGVDGTIYVADTYNDRIRAIDAESRVRTLAGGDEPGMMDAATGADARFDTPCGIAVASDNALVVADTGNNRLRRVEPGSGAVTTIAGTGERRVTDGPPFAASFDEPTGVAVDAYGTIFVADAGGNAVRVYRSGSEPQVSTLAGYHGAGVIDGPLADARLRAPSGVAVAGDGTLIIADTGNRLVRIVVGETRERGARLTQEAALALYPTAGEMRRSSEDAPRWPYDPAIRPREIAATFGEIRGEITAANKEAYFHNGLDIPGAYGEIARAVREERVLLPLAVEDAGTSRERIRFPQLGYIHLRVGRDQSDRVLDDSRFRLRRDSDARVVGVRVRRGERFAAGDPLGTLNNQYHVHLIAGPTGGELNALAALELPGIKDTVAPVIEKDGVRLFNREWQELRAPAAVNNGKRKIVDADPIQVEGDVRIVARTFDQMDGNARRRKLGLYRLGYQILNGDGSAAQGFDQPLMTVSFETLPVNRVNAAAIYAEGSRSGASGETIFAYIVTNVMRDYRVEEGFWQAGLLPAGDYTLRVLAEDFFGNRTARDVSVRIVANAK